MITVDKLEKAMKNEEINRYFDQEFIISKVLLLMGLDNEIVEQVCKFGYPKDYII